MQGKCLTCLTLHSSPGCVWNSGTPATSSSKAGRRHGSRCNGCGQLSAPSHQVAHLHSRSRFPSPFPKSCLTPAGTVHSHHEETARRWWLCSSPSSFLCSASTHQPGRIYPEPPEVLSALFIHRKCCILLATQTDLISIGSTGSYFLIPRGQHTPTLFIIHTRHTIPATTW